MRIHAGEQHGPGWRAVGRGVIIGKTHALLRQRVDSGRANFAAIGREIGEAKIICQYQHDIGSLNRCCSVLCCGTCRLICQRTEGRKQCQCDNCMAEKIINRHPLGFLCKAAGGNKQDHRDHNLHANLRR